MSYSVRVSRPGAGVALRRELVVPARIAPGPAHPPSPSPPRDERPVRTTWRWVTATGLALVVLLSAWAFGPGGYVVRSTTPDLTPVATVVSVGGRVEARLGAGASWAPLQRGDLLRAGADVPTAPPDLLVPRTVYVTGSPPRAVFARSFQKAASGSYTQPPPTGLHTV